MNNINYCSTGWNLYGELADTHLSFDKHHSEERFEKDFTAAKARLEKHFHTCVQCSIEESRFEKKRATPTR